MDNKKIGGMMGNEHICIIGIYYDDEREIEQLKDIDYKNMFEYINAAYITFIKYKFCPYCGKKIEWAKLVK